MPDFDLYVQLEFSAHPDDDALEHYACCALDALVDDTYGIALGPVVTANTAAKTVELFFTLEADGPNEMGQKQSIVLDAVDKKLKAMGCVHQRKLEADLVVA